MQVPGGGARGQNFGGTAAYDSWLGRLIGPEGGAILPGMVVKGAARRLAWLGVVAFLGSACGEVSETDRDAAPNGAMDAAAAQPDGSALGIDASGDEPDGALIDAGDDNGPAEQRIGWYEDTGGSANLGIGYVAGVQVQVGSSAVLQAFGIVSRGTGVEVKMGLYRQSGGEPEALVAFTETFELDGDRQEIEPTAVVELPAGNYWIMAAPASAVLVGANENAEVEVKFKSVGFADAMPDPYPSDGSSTSAPPYNFYIVVSQ
jgi:hypothetical protein